MYAHLLPSRHSLDTHASSSGTRCRRSTWSKSSPPSRNSSWAEGGRGGVGRSILKGRGRQAGARAHDHVEACIIFEEAEHA